MSRTQDIPAQRQMAVSFANGHRDASVMTPPGSPPEPLRASTPESLSSVEDYDEMTRADQLRRKHAGAGIPNIQKRGAISLYSGSSSNSSTSVLPPVQTEHDVKAFVVKADDDEIREVLRRGLERAKDPSGKTKVRAKFSDLVFTRKFSAFDRQNADAANSPFHGFFTLFWMAMFFFMIKIGAENWRKWGNPLGSNEIVQSMVRRDLFVLLLSDGVMCGLTGVSWLMQRLIYAGYLDWDRSGFILQNVWQAMFIGGVIGFPLLRDWPWTHTVFFVLHGVVMLMKQHSYAFYNGHLSTAYKKRAHLFEQLHRLDHISPVQSPSQTEPPPSALSTTHLSQVPSALGIRERRHSIEDYEKSTGDMDSIAAAIESGSPLDHEQVHVFERMIKWEIDALTDELKGKSTTQDRAYPNNLSLKNHYEYIVLPTVVYELEYPRSDSINWYYAAEKMAACFGIIFVMIMISQAFIYPVVIQTVKMKEAGMPLAQRFQAFPWMLSDLLFPFMFEYLMAWYLIWETILNFLAEVTYFADRTFYDAWWNSVSWDQFARDWNRPVHNFLLRHVYHSSISALKVNKHTATLITFFLSACMHELVMWCIFKKLRGYLLFLQMSQVPVSGTSRLRIVHSNA
ncbi:MBOAT family protein, partial [Coniochaeta sp. 2T2.1]